MQGTRFISIPDNDKLGLPKTIAIKGFNFQEVPLHPVTFQPTGQFSPVIPEEDIENRIPIYTKSQYSYSATEPQSQEIHLCIHSIKGASGIAILRLTSEEFALCKGCLNNQLEPTETDEVRLIDTDLNFRLYEHPVLSIDLRKLCFEKAVPIYCTTSSAHSKRAA